MAYGPDYTRIVIQNDTSSPLTLHKNYDWCGEGDAPELKANKTDDFTHSADGSSIGAVAYTVRIGRQEYRWVIAWSNRSDHSNQAYTKILSASERIDFNGIRAKLQQSGNKSSDKNGFLSASLVIDRDDTPSPTLTAVLTTPT